MKLYQPGVDHAESADLTKSNPEIVARVTKLALEWKATFLTTVDPSCISTADRAAKPAAASAPSAPTKKAPIDRAAGFMRMDPNRDGVLSFEEYVDGMNGAPNLASRFKNFDKDGDGKLSSAEFVTPSGR